MCQPRARALEHMTSFCVFSHVRTEATMSERQCELHDRIKTLCSEGKGSMVKKAAAGLAIHKHVRSPIAKIMYFARSYAVFMQDFFLAQYDADMIVLC